MHLVCVWCCLRQYRRKQASLQFEATNCQDLSVNSIHQYLKINYHYCISVAET